MLVPQHTLLTRLLPHLITSKTILLQLQVLIIKHSNHRHIIRPQPQPQRLYIHLNPRTADLLLEDTTAHNNDLLFLTNHLLLLLVEVVVVVTFPIYPGLPRAAAEVGRW